VGRTRNRSANASRLIERALVNVQYARNDVIHYIVTRAPVLSPSARHCNIDRISEANTDFVVFFLPRNSIVANKKPRCDRSSRDTRRNICRQNERNTFEGCCAPRPTALRPFFVVGCETAAEIG